MREDDAFRGGGGMEMPDFAGNFSLAQTLLTNPVIDVDRVNGSFRVRGLLSKNQTQDTRKV